MTTLKEQMAVDAWRVFMNPEEFAEGMDIDGLPCWGQWDDVLQPSGQFFGSTLKIGISGVNTIERLLFVLPQDAGAVFPLPVPDQDLLIDGEIWTVQDARPEGNIFKLTIFRHES